MFSSTTSGLLAATRVLTTTCILMAFSASLRGQAVEPAAQSDSPSFPGSSTRLPISPNSSQNGTDPEVPMIDPMVGLKAAMSAVDAYYRERGIFHTSRKRDQRGRPLRHLQ